MTIPQQPVSLETSALTLWGKPSDRLVVTVHGLHSHQGDVDTQAAVRQALARKGQALTWDLPGHGVRPGTPEDCRLTDAAAELAQIWDWACDPVPHAVGLRNEHGRLPHCANSSSGSPG